MYITRKSTYDCKVVNIRRVGPLAYDLGLLLLSNLNLFTYWFSSVCFKLQMGRFKFERKQSSRVL